MRCNLTKLVRCMMLVVITVVCINIFVVLNSRPISTGFLGHGMFGPQGHAIHASRTSTQRPPLRLNSTVTCPGLGMMQPGPEGKFQIIAGINIYVYSAYLDGGKVKVIALREYTSMPLALKCQVWYDVKGQDPLVLTEATLLNMQEDHGRKYTAAFIFCELPDHMRNETPRAVSLVAEEKCMPANNVLFLSDPGKMGAQFTVCVTPMNYRYSRAYELVEMIEMNKLLGADKFVFYNHSTGPNVDQVLEAYRRSGDVEVHQWHLPIKTDTWPPTHEPEVHYFAQLAALNDCLYRHKNRSKYLVYQDIDEFIIPYKHDTWAGLARERETNVTNMTAMQFKCVFFRKEWPKSAPNFEAAAEKFKSVILRNTIRETKFYEFGSRSKYIVNPRKATMVGVHNIWTYSGNVDTVFEVDGALHHYRSWEYPSDPIGRIEDPATAVKYGSRLVDRLRTAWSRLDNVKMDINISSYGHHV